jgi:3-polyprenyl-4-hydroxybenzoate decarboxylase
VDASDDAPLPVLDRYASEELSRIHQILSSPQGYDRSIQRQRVTATLESGTVTTVTTVIAVNTVNTVTALGGDQAQLLTRGSNLSAWRDCVRTLIT